MFAGRYFAPRYFAGRYFPPAVATGDGGVKSMMAPWMGGAGTFTGDAGKRSMMAFWAGGAGVDERTGSFFSLFAPWMGGAGLGVGPSEEIIALQTDTHDGKPRQYQDFEGALPTLLEKMAHQEALDEREREKLKRLESLKKKISVKTIRNVIDKIEPSQVNVKALAKALADVQSIAPPNKRKFELDITVESITRQSDEEAILMLLLMDL